MDEATNDPYLNTILYASFMIYASPMATATATAPAPPTTRLGRPRSERARVAILAAAADLLVEGGLHAATIEAIAARAGVSKVTIYKWWPTRGAVAIDSYFHRYGQTIHFEDTGDLTTDLVTQMRVLIGAFRGRAGAVMAELVGHAQADPNLAETLRSGWLKPRRDATTAVLQRAIDRGDIDAQIDIPAVLDQLYAPLYYRLIMAHEPRTDDLAETLVRTVLDGIRPR
jgi:AcrR family transcriptional regulator